MAKAFHGLEVPTELEEICSSQRLTVLVYDMQAGIANQVDSAIPIVAKLGQLLAAARAARIRTFFTRHMSLPKELMGAFQLRMAMAWQRVPEPDLVEPWFLATHQVLRSSRN